MRSDEMLTDTPTRYGREPTDAHPPLDYPPYRSSALRHPNQPLVYLPHTITEITGPQLFSDRPISECDTDLTRQHEGEPIGERIIVSGRVLDTDGKPLPQRHPQGQFVRKSDPKPTAKGNLHCLCNSHLGKRASRFAPVRRSL